MCFHTYLIMIDNAIVCEWLGGSCFVHWQVLGLPRGQDNTMVVGIEMV